MSFSYTHQFACSHYNVYTCMHMYNYIHEKLKTNIKTTTLSTEKLGNTGASLVGASLLKMLVTEALQKSLKK